jgi:hypothetical protein
VKQAGAGAGAGASSRATLRDPSRARAAATHLGLVLSNRWVAHSFSARLALAGTGGGAAAAPEFDGFVYGPADAGTPLGRRAATVNASTGEWGLDVVLEPLTLQFWVQAVA